MLFNTVSIVLALVASSAVALPIGEVEVRGIKDKTAINIITTVGELAKDAFDKASVPKVVARPGIASTIAKPVAAVAKSGGVAADIKKLTADIPKLPVASVTKAASVLDQIPKDIFKDIKREAIEDLD